jgi:3-dehydroquinate dehydratase-2
MSAVNPENSKSDSDFRRLLRSGDRVWKIGLINGPNMSNLIDRPLKSKGIPHSIEDLEAQVDSLCRALGVVLARKICSDYEGDILTWLHDETRNQELDGLIINPAGLTFAGYAARAALCETGLPAIEVHYQTSNKWDGLESIFTRSVVGTCMGLRRHSYDAAVVAIVGMLDDGDYAPSAAMLNSSRRDKPGATET